MARNAKGPYGFLEALLQAKPEAVLMEVQKDPRVFQAACLEVQEELKNLNSQVQDLNNQVQDLNIELLAQKRVSQLLSIQAPKEPQTRLSEKLPDAPVFSGERKELRTFIASLRLKLQGNADRYPLPQNQLQYAYSRLSGKAAQQVLPRVKSAGIDFVDLEDMIRFLENAFGDPDRKASAQRELQTLKQKNQDFATFIAEFLRVAPDAEFNEESQKAMLLSSLSRELRELLINHDIPDTLGGLISLCQKLDSKQRAFRDSNMVRSTTRSFFNTAQKTSTPKSTGTTSTSGPEPMDLSTTYHKKGPLTDAEKDRRRKQGLCLFCRGAGHFAMTCPNKKGRPVGLREMETTQSSRVVELNEEEAKE